MHRLTTNHDLTITRGFTLVETLLAIALLSLAVIVPLSVASSGLSAALTGKDRVIAVSLARDGVEYIRVLRDNNRAGDVWLEGLEGCTITATTPDAKCMVDSLRGKVDAVTTTPPKPLVPLKYLAEQGVYGYANWSGSKFTRWITIEEIQPGLEARVTSTVTWRTLASTKSVTVSVQLLRW